MLSAYYRLIKPGIVYGNAFAALAGFLFASRWHFGFGLFAAAMLGVAFVVASACVFNNYFDHDIDQKMPRTKDRPLASGAVSPGSALWYGGVLFVIGFCLLYFFVNVLSVAAAFVGWFVYVFCYTPLKHKSSLALYVGAVAGAMPIVIGYVAGSGKLDRATLILFILFFLWQLPHFLAIATYRFDEYAAAGVPLSLRHAPSPRQKVFARRVFFASLWVLVVGCVLIALLPLVL